MMVEAFGTTFGGSTPTRSWRVWAGSRIAAVVIGSALVWALLSLTPIKPQPDAPAIQAVVTTSLEVLTPSVVPPPAPDTLPKADSDANAKTRENTRSLPVPRLSQDRPKPIDGKRDFTPSIALPTPSGATTVPRMASAPSGISATSEPGLNESPQSGAASAPLRSGTIAILRARECARLDIADRPADCPSNAELLRLLGAERDPRYRPENAEGFSRNELAWRGVPPPCLDDGVSSGFKGGKACLRFGNTPSRVRTVREICEAKGLGGCAPIPSQAAINAAVEQVRRQQAGN